MQSYKATFLPTNSYCLSVTIEEKRLPKPLIQAFYHDQQAIITWKREYTKRFQNNKDVTVDIKSNQIKNKINSKNYKGLIC